MKASRSEGVGKFRLHLRSERKDLIISSVWLRAGERIERKIIGRRVAGIEKVWFAVDFDFWRELLELDLVQAAGEIAQVVGEAWLGHLP